MTYNTHTTASTLPIYNFQQVINTNDLGWICIFDLKKGEKKPDIKEAEINEYKAVWENIIKELPTTKEQNEANDILTSYALAVWDLLNTDVNKKRKRYFYYVNYIRQLEAQLEQIQEKQKQNENKTEKINILPLLVSINSELNLNLSMHDTDILTFTTAEQLYTESINRKKEQLEKYNDKKI